MNLFSTGKNKSEVLVFAFPRTGSTTLAEALGLFWRTRIMLEPFNTRDGYVGQRGEVNNKEMLFSALDEISGQGINIVKHLNIQLSRELNCRLLEYGFRSILFLWRQNAVKRAVSNEISFQAREWRRNRDKILSTEFEALDIEKMKGNISWYRQEVKWYRDFMTKSGIPFTEIVMEDLYQDSMAEKEKLILELARKCFPLRSLRYNKGALRELLSPEVSKLNSRDTYKLIPNIDEVDRELSSEENGYLFG